jgi:hypothetical protein
MKLVVSVRVALNILKANRDKHVAEYELQLEAWKKAYAEHTEALREWSQEQPSNEEETRRPKEPNKPQYHVKSYDRLINKLTAHVLDTIELSNDRFGGNDEYDQIFENKFDWSGSFASLSAGYITTGHISEADINTIRGE